MKIVYSIVLAAGMTFAQQDVLVFHQNVPAPPVPTNGNATFVRTMAFESTVKGAPYSAESVTEHVQTLPDGNRISHTNKTSIARDSEGRTRREMVVNNLGRIGQPAKAVVSISINDPVAKVHYSLDPERKVAMRMKQEAGEPRWTEKAGNVTIARTIEGRGSVISDVATTVTLSAANAENIRREDLGVRSIEGVTARGTRTTMVIPAGSMGNERPMEVVTERWYSDQLKTVVLSRHSDPRSGETTTRLTNVQLAEPSRSLFEPPADYKVEEAQSMVMPDPVIRIKEDR